MARSDNLVRLLRVLVVLVLLVSLVATQQAANAGGGPSDRDGNKIYDDLDQAMRGKSSDAVFDVIVVFGGGDSGTQVASARRDVGSFSVKYKYQYIAAAAARMTVAQVRAVASRWQTRHVQPDAPVEAFIDTARETAGATEAAGDFGVDGNNQSSANCPGLLEYCKDDVVVSVIDTGIDATHIDLNGGKVLAFANCYRRDPCEEPLAFDDNGHGTHVASMIAGEGSADSESGTTTRDTGGVAPGAALVGVKVLNQRGSGYMSDVDRGIEWTISNRATYGIRALNLSLGTSGCSDGKDSSSLLVNQAFASGITPFVAAGNSGPKKCTIGSPGAAKDAVTVGAMADSGDNDGSRVPGWSLASFSSRGPTADGRQKPDIAAPGVDILAAKANTGNDYVVYSGTSMATPFTAGVAALMLDASPGLSATQIKSTLVGNALDWGPGGSDIDYGAGRLDAYAAVDAVSSVSATQQLVVPVHEFREDTLTSSETNHYFEISAETGVPIAVTFVMPDWSGSSSPDFDIYLLDAKGNTVAQSTGTSRQETIGYRPSSAGTYTLRVHRYAGSGNYWLDLSYATRSVTANTAPVLSASNPISAGVNEDQSVSFSVAASDAQTCELAFSIASAPGNGSASVTTNDDCVEGASSNTDSATITYTHDGSETESDAFTYRVTDVGGEYAQAEISVTVSAVDDAPTADFTYVCSALTCNFTDRSSDPDSDITAWSWDFGADGGDEDFANDTSSTRHPSYTFAGDGTYRVSLTATSGSVSGNVAKSVTVSSSSIDLYYANPYKIKGVQHVDLKWSWPGSSATTEVDIKRDGGKIGTQPQGSADGGSYTDNLNKKGGGSYTYQICEKNTTNCSQVVTVNF